jgi:hypothetical protein
MIFYKRKKTVIFTNYKITTGSRSEPHDQKINGLLSWIFESFILLQDMVSNCVNGRHKSIFIYT